MKPERELPNSKTTSLRESVASSLEALNLLSAKLKGFPDGEKIATSLQKLRASVIKSDPTLIWQKPSQKTSDFQTWQNSMTTVEVKEENPLPPPKALTKVDFDVQEEEFQESQTKTQTSEPAILVCPESNPSQVRTSESGNNNGVMNQFNNDDSIKPEMAEDLIPLTKEDTLEEISQVKHIEEDRPEDLALADEMTIVQDRAGTDYMEEDLFEEDDEVDEEDDVPDGISTGKDLNLVKMYLREVGQIPIQVEKHETWGGAIFVGEMALKTLNQLSESPLLTPTQKEKVFRVLESKKGKFLLECLNLRTESVQQKLRLDKYKDKHKDDEAAKRAKKLDEDFLKIDLENEILANETLDDARTVEDEDEREMLLGQFIDQQINFANQGQRSHDNLTEANLRLSVSIAKKYQGHGIELLDLIAYGNFGLMKAAADFDIRTGFRFSTHGVWWIRQTITRALAINGPTIRLPVHVHDQINKWKRARAQDLDEDGRSLDTVPKELRRCD